jgi:hypothetical protein
MLPSRVRTDKYLHMIVSVVNQLIEGALDGIAQRND